LAAASEVSAAAVPLASAAAFFVFFAVVVVALDASDAVPLASAAAFFVFFLVVLAALSAAVASLDASCARTCVVNRNKPISAATASMKTFFLRIRFITILRPRNQFFSEIFLNFFWPVDGFWLSRCVSAWDETELNRTISAS
jgi:hypothetical protein